ncbi:MAG: MFS transporter [Candidatus Rokuibacteriota bacterium]|nr:MAG: MFS transporter [Candidatus Rokubacteria bacterium]
MSLRRLHRRPLMNEARKRWIFVGIMLSIFLAAIESTVVATAMPTVVASLGGIRIYSWVFSGFLLTQTVTMPLWGRFSDLYGRRPVYLAGLATFLVGSALSGAAQNMVQLILFRMVQGLGAGAVMTLGYTIIGELFGLERRARMQGYISSVWGVASLMGPWAGGLLTDHVSWRWVFYINLPFGAVAMALIAGALTSAARPARRPVVDGAGVALFAAGVSAVLLGIVEAGRVGSWSRTEVVVLLVLGAAVLAAFVAVEQRAAEPIVPLRLFKNRMVLAAVVTRFLAGMAMFGALSFVPLFLQAVTGATATRAGIVLTPFVLGWVVMSVVSARFVLRVGYRTVVLIGMASLMVAFLLFQRWSVTLSPGRAMVDVLLAGIGMGMVVVPMLIAVQSVVARSDLGAATSLTQFFMSIGGALGLSLMGAVMSQRLHAGLPMADALHGVFVVGAGVCVAALASAFMVPAGRAQDLARREMRGEPTRVGG